MVTHQLPFWVAPHVWSWTGSLVSLLLGQRCRGNRDREFCCSFLSIQHYLTPLIGWIVSLRNTYVEILMPNTLEYDLSQGEGFCRGSVQFSHSVVSDSFRTHELQHARHPCSSPTPRVHPNPCPLSQWCQSDLIVCCPRVLLPHIPPSIRVFSNESTLHMRWPKY